MTLDNTPARITQGYQIPITVANLTTVQTNFINAALQLEVTPHVTGDGLIHLSVEITDNHPDYTKTDNLGAPAIFTKEVSTELLVRDGETTVILRGIISNPFDSV